MTSTGRPRRDDGGHRRAGRHRPPTAAVLEAGVFLAVAELAALLVARDGSPILAVGAFVIDIVPQPVKEFAIAAFG